MIAEANLILNALDAVGVMRRQADGSSTAPVRIKLATAADALKEAVEDVISMLCEEVYGAEDDDPEYVPTALAMISETIADATAKAEAEAEAEGE